MFGSVLLFFSCFSNKLYSETKTTLGVIQTKYGDIYLRKSVNTVGVYGVLENLPLNEIQIELSTDYNDFNPNFAYAVIDAKSTEMPYCTVGSLWLYPDGKSIQLYKLENISSVYIAGNYVIQ